MHWIVLGFVSALLLGAYDVFRKAALDRNAVLPVLWISTVASSLPFLALWLAGRTTPLPIADHGLIALKSVIVAASWVLEFFALKHLALSVAAPLRASQPFFTLIGAVFLLGEQMSVLRWSGVLATLGSYVLFSLGDERQGRAAGKGRWILCTLGASVIGAGSSLYDKYLFNHLALPPLTVQCWYTVYIAILLGGVLIVGWRTGGPGRAPFRWSWAIPCIGLCLAASDALYFHALRHPDALIAMLAALRRANVVIGFAAGIWWFGEAGGGRRTVALFGILVGLLAMTLG